MKVVHIVEASFAGVGRHVIDLAEHQAGSHDVFVIYGSRRCSSDFVRRIEQLPDISWFPLNIARDIGVGDISSFISCRRLLKKIQPNIVHGHSSKGGALARMCSDSTVGVFYTPNAMYTMNPGLSSLKKYMVSSIERLFSCRTTRIIAVSPEERDHMVLSGINRDKIVVIPNGIERPTKYLKSDVRKALGLSDNDFIIGFVGRIDAQKSPEKLLSIFKAYLSVQISDTKLAIVGDGPMLEEMKMYATKLGINDHVCWLGFQKGVWAMCAFDVFLLPSAYEGFPYVLLESIGVGVPFVTSDRANASLLVNNGGAGSIVPLEQDEKFVSGLLEMEKNLRAGLKRACVLDNRFLVSHMAAVTTDLYSRSSA